MYNFKPGAHFPYFANVHSLNLTHLTEEGEGPAVELPLLVACLSARRLGERVNHLVRVDQVLTADREGERAAEALGRCERNTIG